MDTPAQRSAAFRAALPASPAPAARVTGIAVPRQRTSPDSRVTAAYAPLAQEMRHSALLLGGALGLMAAFAVVLLMLTTGLGGAA